MGVGLANLAAQRRARCHTGSKVVQHPAVVQPLRQRKKIDAWFITYTAPPIPSSTPKILPQKRSGEWKAIEIRLEAPCGQPQETPW